MRLPQPRGEHSRSVIDALAQPLGDGLLPPPPTAYAAAPGGIVHDEDAQLALWVLYELHYLGFDDVDPEWQWHPDVVRYLGWLERHFLAALQSLPVPGTDASAPMHTRIECPGRPGPECGAGAPPAA